MGYSNVISWRFLRKCNFSFVSLDGCPVSATLSSPFHFRSPFVFRHHFSKRKNPHPCCVLQTHPHQATLKISRKDGTRALTTRRTCKSRRLLLVSLVALGKVTPSDGRRLGARAEKICQRWSSCGARVSARYLWPGRVVVSNFVLLMH